MVLAGEKSTPAGPGPDWPALRLHCCKFSLLYYQTSGYAIVVYSSSNLTLWLLSIAAKVRNISF